MIFKEERKEVAKTMRKLYKQGLTTSTGGNISLRDNENRVFITATGIDKSSIRAKDIIVFAPNGENLTPNLKPSMELNMHMYIYKARPDVYAIAHAHPVYAGTFAITGTKPLSSITGEARFILGDIEVIDYQTMGTKELANACAEKLKHKDTAIMKNHGAICVGKTLLDVFNKMEVLENTCNIHFNTLLLGKCNPISDTKLKEIDIIKQQTIKN